MLVLPMAAPYCPPAPAVLFQQSQQIADFHYVYPYRDAENAKWPGYRNFGQAGFSNAWGPRNPSWTGARLFHNYFARLQ